MEIVKDFLEGTKDPHRSSEEGNIVIQMYQSHFSELYQLVNFRETSSEQYRRKGSGKSFREKGKFGERISTGATEHIKKA